MNDKIKRAAGSKWAIASLGVAAVAAATAVAIRLCKRYRRKGRRGERRQ
jgi:hypothetical protein